MSSAYTKPGIYRTIEDVSCKTKLLCSNKLTLVDAITPKDSIIVHPKKYSLNIKYHNRFAVNGYSMIESEIIGRREIKNDQLRTNQIMFLNIDKCKLKHSTKIMDVESNQVYKMPVDTDVTSTYGDGFYFSLNS